MRIYNPALGKFLSVDPIADEYPWNSTYAFAENDLIRCIDLDGGEKDRQPFQTLNITGRTKLDYCKAVLNAPTNVVNGTLVLARDALTIVRNNTEVLFNKGPFKWAAEVKKEWSDGAKEASTNLNSNVKAVVDYHKSTPGGQILKDYAKAVTSPQTLEGTLTIGIGIAAGKLQAPGPNYNMAVAQSSELSELEAARAQYSSSSVIIRAELPNGAKVTSPGGPPQPLIAENLLIPADKIGGVGTKRAGNTVGCCAEFHAANKLLLDNPTFKPKDIKFTTAIRPRTGQIVPQCENCFSIFGPNVKPVDW